MGGSSVEEDEEDLLRDLNTKEQMQDQSNILLHLDTEEQESREEKVVRKLNLQVNNSCDEVSKEDLEHPFLLELLHQRITEEEDQDGLRGGF